MLQLCPARYHVLLYMHMLVLSLTLTSIYTLYLHDALPISLPATAQTGPQMSVGAEDRTQLDVVRPHQSADATAAVPRSEEHTSELQSHSDLVCRLLLEKKKKKINDRISHI